MGRRQRKFNHAQAVIARLAASAKASAYQYLKASAKPWRSRDRAIQYAAAVMMRRNL
jgi:hypothetical protein